MGGEFVGLMFCPVEDLGGIGRAAPDMDVQGSMPIPSASSRRSAIGMLSDLLEESKPQADLDGPHTHVSRNLGKHFPCLLLYVLLWLITQGHPTNSWL